MNNHEQSREQFLPEIVDEHVEQLLRLHRHQKTPMAPDEQLVSDLRILYEANTGTRERVWQRLAERIASNDAITAPLSTENKQSVQKRITSFERHRTMKHETLTPQRIHIQHLNLVAAVLWTALVVGSMLWIFTLARNHTNGYGTASPGGAKQQQTVAQQNRPSPSGVYVNSGRSLRRVDLQTGEEIWRYELPRIPMPYYNNNANAVSVVQFVLVGDTVYALISSSSSQYKTAVVALNAENGKVRWSQPLTPNNSLKPYVDPLAMTVDDGIIYVPVRTDKVPEGEIVDVVICSFSTKDGKRGTTYSMPTHGNIYYVAALKGTLYVGAQKGVYAFDPASSHQRWYTALQPENANQTLVISKLSIVNGVLYAAVVSANGAGPAVSRVAAFSLDSGKQLWQSDLIEGRVSDITLSNGVVYFGSAIPKAEPFEGALYAYDAQNGKQLWHQKTDGAVQVAPSVSNGVVYASAYVGLKLPENVVAVGAGDGKQQWQHQIIAGQMTTPHEENGLIYVAGGFDKGKLYALKAENGSQVWTLDLEGGPGDIAVVA